LCEQEKRKQALDRVNSKRFTTLARMEPIDEARIAHHARHTFENIKAEGHPTRPLDFPPPRVRRGRRVNALVVHPRTGTRDVLAGVLHRESFRSRKGTSNSDSLGREEEDYVAYYPQRRLQDAIYGAVWACLVLRRHRGRAEEDAAAAARVRPGDPNAPIVWEITGQHVAIKMIEWARVMQNRGRLLEDPIKEIAAMQLIGTEHPNVLGCMEVLQDDDYLYSIMPYARGGDLFGYVVNESRAEGGMEEPVARYWFRQILEGLHYLQSKGICHRDLSLENILVDENLSLIIDFGMCLRAPYTSRTNPKQIASVSEGMRRRLILPQGTCGKHNYMSPEIYRNRDPFDGFAIDLWAAGVILYIMLTGFPPYDHATLSDQRFEIIVDGQLMDQLHQWDIHLSEEAGKLLQSMLRLNPRDRLTLADVMAHPWVVDENVTPPTHVEAPY